MNPRTATSSAALPSFSPVFQVEIQREGLAGIGSHTEIGFADLSPSVCKSAAGSNPLLGVTHPNQLCINLVMTGRC